MNILEEKFYSFNKYLECLSYQDLEGVLGAWYLSKETKFLLLLGLHSGEDR